MPRFSIIIPTYNHLEDCLKPCIESIYRFTNLKDAEVIVVANGCTDDTRKYVESCCGPFRLIWMDEPAGFVKATNAGIRAATGEFVVLLNNDTILKPQLKNEWLDMLVAPFSDRKVGITGPYKDVRFAWDSGRVTFREAYLVFYCAMMRRSLFDHIGPLDESFGVGYEEDIDFCIRAQKAGYSLKQVPKDVRYDLSMGKEYLLAHPNKNEGFPLHHKDKMTFKDLPPQPAKESRLLTKHKRPSISIIIPTYNHLEDCLKPCIESIISHTDLSDVEVIVVANGCKDGTVDYVESLGRPFKLFFIEEAAGYTKATNEGINAAQGEYIVLLNNDNVILPSAKDEWLNMLKAPFLQDGSVGVTGAAKNIHKGTGSEFLLFFCVMLKRNIVDRFGLLDEVFNPGYGEDIDYCNKLRKAGYKIVQVPNDVNLTKEREPSEHVLNFPIWHKGGATVTTFAGWDKVVPKNEQILLERYGVAKSSVGQTVTEAVYNKRLQIGRLLDEIDSQEITPTIDRLSASLPSDGLICAELDSRTRVTVAKSGFANSIFKGKNGFANIRRDPRELTDRSLAGIREFVLGSGSKNTDWFGGRFVGGYCAQQNPDEISEYLYDFRNMDIENYLEIGVADGAVTRLFCDTIKVQNVFTIDLGWADMNYPDVYRNSLVNLRNKGKIEVFRGDSHSAEAEEWLKSTGQKFDFIFIDAEHTYEGVIKDTMLAKRYAKPGAIFVYHDHACVPDIFKFFQDMAGGAIPGFDLIKAYVAKDEVKKKGISVFRYAGEEDDRPKYSIIIPTYNHLEDCLKPCIESLIAHTDLMDAEVIIVANGCKDGTREYIEQLGEPFRFVWMDEQAGYIKATNAGIANAKGEFVVLLNNDVFMLHQRKGEWLDILEKPFHTNPKAGITGPLKAWRGDIGHEYVLFFCAMMRKSLFDEIGLLDERFGIGYHEDVDFCIRAKKAGYDLIEVPENIIYTAASQGSPGRDMKFPIWHKGGATFAPIYGDSSERLERHAPLLYSKHGMNPLGSVYDCFMFFNELDILEIRLNELCDVVDRFVLVEARFTHQGKPKPLYFEENKQRFSKFLHKIEHIVVDEFPETDDTWVREPFQRNCAMRGLTNCNNNDIIILSDVDEIPKASVVKNYERKMGLTCIQTRLFYYKLNYLSNIKWYKLRIFPFSEIKGGDLQQFRGKNDYEYKTIVEDGGWHFSFLGDAEHIRKKIESYGHIEYNNDHIKSEENILGAINNGKDVFGRDIKFSVVDIDDSYPEFVRSNLNYYKSQGLVAHGDVFESIRQRLFEQDRFIYEEVLQWNCYNAEASEIAGRTVFDVGANIGTFCFLIHTYGAKKILAFEPHPANFERLSENTKSFSEVIPIPVAIHSHSGELRMAHGGAVARVFGDSEGPLVKAISLHDALALAEPGDDSLVLKLDAEGSEYDILKAAPEDIRRFEIIYAEFHNGMHPDQSNTMDAIEQHMVSLGYESVPVKEHATAGYWYFDETTRKMEFAPTPDDNVKVNRIVKLIRTEAPQKPKVYDCFSFFNELDLLEIRLNELDPYVDKFVLSEMTVTHSGNPKPLYFAQNRDRFSKFLHKIEYVAVADCPDSKDPWVREHFQRNALVRGLRDCQDEDIIIVSDLDEIPRGDKISQYDGQREFMYFEQHQYNYYLNMSVGISQPGPGAFSRVTTYGNLKKMGLRTTDLRYRDCTLNDRIENGGWHFSWMGGAQGIVTKLESWAHQELNIPEFKDQAFIETNINSSIDAFARPNAPHRPKMVLIDDSFPQYIRQNVNKLPICNMVKKTDRVAIVMPYYNDREMLVKSVLGIVGQTHRDWTLFLVDDGSAVESQASRVLGGKLGSRVVFIDKINGGVSSARNAALEAIRKDASFEYVAYCDSDDIWEECYLESQIKAISDCDLVYSNVSTEFVDGSKAYAFGIPNPTEYPGLEFMLQQPFIYISSVVHRRKCMSVGDFDGTLNSIEDWDMWIRIAKAGHRFKKNEETTITYTVKTDSNMASRRTDEIYAAFRKKHS